MAQFDPAISSLGSSEERLRRSLGLVGLQQTDFDPAIKPVVIVDDATRPGCNIFRGRYFSIQGAKTIPAAGSATAYGLIANHAVIIERIRISAAEVILPETISSIKTIIQLFAVVTASPGTMATPDGIWTELLERSQTDRPPILTGSGAMTATGTTVATIFQKPNTTYTHECKYHLAQGGRLTVFLESLSGLVTSEAYIGIDGRVF